ncbi:centromere-associated protein K-domain-containing protein [Gilbertella persicaria]|uniref:centromere-associated protein K-domain-containing protein n=1 Tax=Gilbertella persicaria TaxID=101096 RepID=UPI0022211AC6|nr:centromere-associated protein K-domain-containing protein [Gilbertella persicaria]KAI8087020.1 centromere-associated protein K-domain-containing protein [Gilbertella persicaria]
MRNAIKTVISNATKSYIDIATTDPVVESQEDGTSRGDFLDLVIKEQKKENKRLWDKLYQLEQQQKEAGKHRVFLPEAEYTTADRKMLSALMYEHRDLSTQITTEMSKVEMFDVPDDTILEVMFRERIEKEIQQYKMTIEFVKEQLSQAKHYLKEEQATLKDTETLHAGLKKEKQRLAHEIRFKLTKEHLREDRVRLEEMIKRDQNDFIDFLDEFYPPHQVDVGNAMNTFKCDLKKVIEELMNKAVNSPDNPYVTLVPGTYWPPYIQTLIQAQVAQYDPQDANRIRLYDFKP